MKEGHSAVIEELVAKHQALQRIPEWKKVIKAKRNIKKRGEKVYRRAGYALINLHLQRFFDDRFLSMLDQLVSDYNGAVIDFRREHGVTPLPTYLCRTLDEHDRLTFPMEGSLREDLEGRFAEPQNNIWVNLPFKEKDYVDDVSIKPYCGFCGDLETGEGEELQDRIFTYRGFSILGLGKPIFACGKQDGCLEMGLADYFDIQGLYSSVGDFVLGITARRMGREGLTRTQAAYLHERMVTEAMEKLVTKKW